MLEWFRRQQKRQADLANGADADLVLDNRNRSRLALYLIGFAILLRVIEAKVHFVGVWHTIVVATTLALLVGGVVLEQWARAERSFLDKPDPQEPKRLWK
jgi:hypothetical protein